MCINARPTALVIHMWNEIRYQVITGFHTTVENYFVPLQLNLLSKKAILGEKSSGLTKSFQINSMAMGDQQWCTKHSQVHVK